MGWIVVLVDEDGTEWEGEKVYRTEEAALDASEYGDNEYIDDKRIDYTYVKEV